MQFTFKLTDPRGGRRPAPASGHGAGPAPPGAAARPRPAPPAPHAARPEGARHRAVSFNKVKRVCIY
jgi:hypothetical protein